MDDKQRLADMETTIAFQDRLLSDLNQVVTDLASRVERLESTLQSALEGRGALVRDLADEDPPPHY